ncbi:phosphatase PAP2 family protein [Streptomyces sp. SID14478]|uniref:phosphatase PAP2 family protein n=1 Tax=Streptomyces sp. SID14478 TaxID=2706073 RepID=UPI0013DB834B|nr:phosphatase PAP2 family protein [Streptomyces sp. SID14478]NEB73933.1 phosphatase PAP2 family protein [Streptomyces sp. SID14478]
MTLTVPRPKRRPSHALPTAICLLLPLAIGALIRANGAAHPPFQSWDDTWLRWMGGPHKGPAQALASALNWFGGPYGALVPLAATALLFALRRPRRALFVLTATLATQLAVQALKHMVDRPRPPHPLVAVDHGSFPSGHAATMAMTVLTIAAFLPPPTRRLWYPAATLLTLTMMWSRTWLHAHWLSDTAAGALAGAGTTLLVWWAFTPLSPKPRT